jgi:TRAP-type C4-dicarboxylate transport system substrate-binding protein
MNTKVIALMDYGSVIFYATRPLNKIEDFEGLKMRSFGWVVDAIYKEFGASPTMLSVGEVYEALHRGMIDGGVSGYQRILVSKWYEVIKYVTPPVVYSLPYFIGINLDFWKTLEPDIQQMFLDVAKEVQVWSIEQATARDEEALRVLQEEKGVTLCQWTPEEEERIFATGRTCLAPLFKKRLGEEREHLWDMALDIAAKYK